jgi:hypothetical protein
MPARDVVEKNKKLFPPGSDIAIQEGCSCSPTANCHGKGYLNRPWTWLTAENCPLHFWEPHKIKKSK